jgi:hypothetical protein
MTRAPITRSVRIPPRARGLFKRDYPRAIDRYIDYFAGLVGHAARLADPCRDSLLDGFGAGASLSRRAAAS